MRNALYPKRFGDACPYCGGNAIKKIDKPLVMPDACSIQWRCCNCGRSHHLNYQAVSVTLESESDIADTDFYYPVAELRDQGIDDPDSVPTVPVGIYAGPDGLMILAAGYGDGGSAVGYGVPVLIEHYGGNLRVAVWNDINHDDVSHIIDLGSAQHAERAPEPEYPFRATRHTPDGVQIEEHQFETLAEAKTFAKSKLSNLSGHFALVGDIIHGTTLWDSRCSTI